MKRWLKSLGVSMLAGVVLLVSPLFVFADAPQTEEAVVLPPVLMTEVQTGSTTGRADEFIELYNTTDQPISLKGWQLRYITASETSSATLFAPSKKIVISQDAVIPAKGYFVLHAGAVSLPAGVAGEAFEATLPAMGGSLILLRPEAVTCELFVEDAWAWGLGRLFGEGKAAVGSASSSKDRLLQRYVDSAAVYVDVNVNGLDIASVGLDSATHAVPTPGTANTQILPEMPPTEFGSESQRLPSTIDDTSCTLPKPDPAPQPPGSPPSVEPTPEPPSADRPHIPAGNVGLLTPQLSELLPNPGAPQTDAADEFIELYNANDAPFDLSGYTIEVGTTTKRRYVIPAGVIMPARSFLAFFSAETKLALSNSGGQVRLLDPFDSILTESAVYTTAKDNHSWLFAKGVWQWSTKPTPNAINVIAPPAAKNASQDKKSSAKTPGSSSKSATGEPKQEDGTANVLAATTNTRSPLHPSVLALVGVSALLYGAYEYRRDLANKIYVFRANRAARAALGQKAARR